MDLGVIGIASKASFLTLRSMDLIASARGDSGSSSIGKPSAAASSHSVCRSADGLGSGFRYVVGERNMLEWLCARVCPLLQPWRANRCIVD